MHAPLSKMSLITTEVLNGILANTEYMKLVCGGEAGVTPANVAKAARDLAAELTETIREHERNKTIFVNGVSQTLSLEQVQKIRSIIEEDSQKEAVKWVVENIGAEEFEATRLVQEIDYDI